jgi:hypothetical protein
MLSFLPKNRDSFLVSFAIDPETSVFYIQMVQLNAKQLSSAQTGSIQKF